VTQVVVRDVSVGYPGRLVLDRVSLTVRPGERLGVIGENGSGKSTVLRLLAGRETPSEGTVKVIAEGGLAYLAQSVDLPPHLPVRAFVDEALADLRALERQMREAEAALGSADEAALRRYSDAVAQYEARDGYRAEARLGTALDRLGLPGLDRDRALGTLSGGEQSRLALACALASEPALLLLDEPTNHLDDDALAWLEKKLAGYRGTLVMATHDRDFLERVTDGIVEVDGDRRTLVRYGDGWTGYLERKAAERHRWEREYQEWRSEVARQEKLAEAGSHRLSTGWRLTESPRFAGHQRSVEGQMSARVRQARERLRRLRENPVPLPPAPLRFTPPPGFGPSAAEPVPDRSPESPEHVAPGAPAAGGPEPLVELVDVVVGTRLRVDRLSLRPGERLLVTGPNGAGKSTLLGVLARELVPDAGTVRLPERIGLLPQDVPAVTSRRSLLAAFAAGLPGEPEEHAPALLTLGLFREEDLALPEAGLSVGQRRRLALARLLTRPVDLLLLDEPTNHLSPALAEELEQALAEYPGTLVLVSHDRRMRSRFTGTRRRSEAGRLLPA